MFSHVDTGGENNEGGLTVDEIQMMMEYLDEQEDLTFDGDINQAKIYVENSQTESNKKRKAETDDNISTTSSSAQIQVVEERSENKFNEIIPIITYSPRYPEYRPLRKENRLNYLCRVPSLLQAAINSSNLEMIKLIIDEAFTENCLCKTPYMDAYRGLKFKLNLCMYILKFENLC